MYNLIQGDCLEEMEKLISDGITVDMILTDPPYGTTACFWDTIIDIDLMWKMCKQILKYNGTTCLFSTQPFTSKVICSNIDNFKYEIIWDKVLPTGFATAKYKPMKQHENILIFCNTKTIYNPQMIQREKPRKYNRNCKQYNGSENLQNHDGEDRVLTHYYPRDILKFSNANHKNRLHPTQKPVELLEYLIKTYTNERETVLDFTMGSGSTGVACLNTNRNFIGIELDQKYYNTAKNRLEEAEK